jgi:hypothetical protein
MVKIRGNMVKNWREHGKNGRENVKNLREHSKEFGGTW